MIHYDYNRLQSDRHIRDFDEYFLRVLRLLLVNSNVKSKDMQNKILRKLVNINYKCSVMSGHCISIVQQTNMLRSVSNNYIYTLHNVSQIRGRSPEASVLLHRCMKGHRLRSSDLVFRLSSHYSQILRSLMRPPRDASGTEEESVFMFLL
jgi:hypothetical protein